MVVDRRARQSVFLLVALIVAAPVAVYAVKALKPRDELFDIYTQYVLAEIAQTNPAPYRQVLNALDRESGTPLSGLEEQYADDPRYWQLRRSIDFDDASEQKLIAAIDRGVYDAASFEAVGLWDVENVGGAKVGEAKVLDYYDKAIACDPHNAWYNYRKADYLLSLGEIEPARELLRQGNASPRFYTPFPFPTSEAYARVGK